MPSVLDCPAIRVFPGHISFKVKREKLKTRKMNLAAVFCFVQIIKIRDKKRVKMISYVL